MTATARTAIAPLVVAAATVAVYLPILTSLVRQWASDDNYSHGFLVVPFALWFVWRDRARLARLRRAPNAAGYLVVAGALLLFLAGRLGAELFLTRVSLIGVVAGSVLALYGLPVLRAIAFPLVLTLVAIPLPAVLFNRIAFPLQLVASRTAETVMSAAGIPVLREGNVLELPAMKLEVAQACSGIRSLVSLIAVALLLGRLAGARRWARVALVVLAVPIAIVANAARVAGTGVAAQWLGPYAAEGFFHEFAGWVVFVAALILLLGVHRCLRRVPSWRHRPSPEAVLS
jgi:exosortase